MMGKLELVTSFQMIPSSKQCLTSYICSSFRWLKMLTLAFSATSHKKWTWNMPSWLFPLSSAHILLLNLSPHSGSTSGLIKIHILGKTYITPQLLSTYLSFVPIPPMVWRKVWGSPFKPARPISNSGLQDPSFQSLIITWDTLKLSQWWDKCGTHLSLINHTNRKQKAKFK